MKRHAGKNVSKQAILTVLRAFLNGLKPGEHLLVYNDNDSFKELSRSMTDGEIRDFIESFRLFNIFNFFKMNKSEKKSDSILDLYEAIKRNIGKDTNLRLFYVLKGNTHPQVTDDNNTIILCKKEHRRTYQICMARKFIQTIKEKAIKGDNRFKDIYSFVGL